MSYTSGGTTEVTDYTYDANNRLTSYNSGSAEATYMYDADNLRASKTVNRAKTDFVWDGQNLATEHKSDATNTYAYDMTGVHIANQDGVVTSYLKDFHGNIVGKTTAAGAMVQELNNRMDYDAFGNQWIGETPNPFGYCGEYYDNESGLIYLRNRYYDTSMGRFITEDPIMDGLNWYVYTDNSPTVKADPSGEAGELILNPGFRQLIWKAGAEALRLSGCPVASEMLYHAISLTYATDVYIKDEWNGVEVNGTNVINGNHVVYALRNNHNINNEIDYRKGCAEAAGQNYFEWSDVLTLNATNDMYLAFNSATVSITGKKNSNGSWIVGVDVHDIYDFDREQFSKIDSFKTAVGGAAGTAAWLEEVPIMGAIKTYDIRVRFLTER